MNSWGQGANDSADGDGLAESVPVRGTSAEQPRIRIWAVVNGAVLAALLCYVSLYGNMVQRTHLSVEYCMAGAMLFLLVLACGVNPILKLLDRALGRQRLLSFSGAELGVIFVMLALASGITTMGFVENLVPAITGGTYYGNEANGWLRIVMPHVPGWAVVTDTDTVRYFYQGLPRGVAAPWRPWVGPLFWWSVFAMAYFAVSVALMMVMRRQWMEYERLVYPIAQVPVEITSFENERALWPRIMKSRVMWMGAAVPLVITSMNCIHPLIPLVPRVRLDGRIPLFGDIVSLRLHFSFVVAGFSFLLNTRVSLSLWLFHVLYAFQAGLFKTLGYSLGEHDPFSHLDPSVSQQAAGAMLVFVAASFWTARRHLANVLRSAIRPDAELEDPAALMSYRWCLITIALGAVVMLAWMLAWGMKLWTASVFLLLAMIGIYFLTRAVAQAGMAAARPVLIPQAMLTHAVGTAAFRPAGLTALAYGFTWSADVRTSVMASTANGLRVVTEPRATTGFSKANRVTILAAVALALLVSLFASYVSVIGLSYEHGAINTSSWFMRGLPQYVQKYATSLLREGAPVGGERWMFTAIGGAVMAFLIWARNSLLWWPVHPVGFVLGASAPVQWSWTGICLAWLVKSLVLRYGGPRLYRPARDAAIGLILGQFLCAGFWLLAAALVDELSGVTVPIL